MSTYNFYGPEFFNKVKPPWIVDTHPFYINRSRNQGFRTDERRK